MINKIRHDDRLNNYEKKWIFLRKNFHNDTVVSEGRCSLSIKRNV